MLSSRVKGLSKSVKLPAGLRGVCSSVEDFFIVGNVCGVLANLKSNESLQIATVVERGAGKERVLFFARDKFKNEFDEKVKTKWEREKEKYFVKIEK